MAEVVDGSYIPVDDKDSLSSDYRLAAALALLAEHVGRSAELLLTAELTELKRAELADALIKMANELRSTPKASTGQDHC
jgi:hypothetical protein